MEEWIRQVFNAPEFGIMVLPAGFLLGIIAAVCSVGCCVPILAGVIGYSGAREDMRRRDVFIASGSFMVGAIIALSVLGALVGYISQAAMSNLGLYGKVLVAILAIFFGLASLNILPFQLPAFSPARGKLPQGVLGASVFGLAVGGASTVFIMGGCGTVMLPAALGLSALRGQGTWGALTMATFTVGYSLPMAGAMLGIGLGKLTGVASKIAKPIQIAAGVLLIAAGFWLLFTL
jgi:cytochrome c biogenesis protein CcdA